MPTKVNIPSLFQKRLDRLRRKFPSVQDDVRKLVQQLKEDERPGDKIPNVGYDVRKVRLRNPSAGRGKSGGFRVIYYVQLANSVFLLLIYSKTEQEDVSPEEIRRSLESILPPDDTE